MKLKPCIDYTMFLRTVQQCGNEVYFETGQGDCLNLKSTLSQFVFAACTSGNLEAMDGRIRCSREDLPLLSIFLRDTGEDAQ